MQRVRHRVALDDRERDHVADGDRTAETPLDAREAQVVGYAEPEGVPPDAGAQHAVVARLDHVDTAIVAAAARDLAGRELVVHRQLLSTGLWASCTGARRPNALGYRVVQNSGQSR